MSVNESVVACIMVDMPHGCKIRLSENSFSNVQRTSSLVSDHVGPGKSARVEGGRSLPCPSAWSVFHDGKDRTGPPAMVLVIPHHPFTASGDARTRS
jgi:hypothetical protein